MAQAESMRCSDALSASPGVLPVCPSKWKLVICTCTFPSCGCCQTSQASSPLLPHRTVSCLLTRSPGPPGSSLLALVVGERRGPKGREAPVQRWGLLLGKEEPCRGLCPFSQGLCPAPVPSPGQACRLTSHSAGVSGWDRPPPTSDLGRLGEASTACD